MVVNSRPIDFDGLLLLQLLLSLLQYRFAGPKELLMMLVASVFSVAMGISIQVPFIAVMNLVNVVAALKLVNDILYNECVIMQAVLTVKPVLH